MIDPLPCTVIVTLLVSGRGRPVAGVCFANTGGVCGVVPGWQLPGTEQGACTCVASGAVRMESGRSSATTVPGPWRFREVQKRNHRRSWSSSLKKRVMLPTDHTPAEGGAILEGGVRAGASPWEH